MLNFIFILLVLISLFLGNAALSVFLGILFTYFFRHSQNFFSRRINTLPLQIGIVLLGATISMPYALSVSADYFPWISLFVIVSFIAGLILGNILGIHQRLAFFLSSGAAICGWLLLQPVAGSISDIAASIFGLFYLGYLPSYWIRLRNLSDFQLKDSLEIMINNSTELFKKAKNITVSENINTVVTGNQNITIHKNSNETFKSHLTQIIHGNTTQTYANKTYFDVTGNSHETYYGYNSNITQKLERTIKYRYFQDITGNNDITINKDNTITRQKYHLRQLHNNIM